MSGKNSQSTWQDQGGSERIEESVGGLGSLKPTDDQEDNRSQESGSNQSDKE